MEAHVADIKARDGFDPLRCAPVIVPVGTRGFADVALAAEAALIQGARTTARQQVASFVLAAFFVCARLHPFEDCLRCRRITRLEI